MNNRIAELKAQCIVREVRGTNAFDNYVVDRFDTERFAELIVRECANIADIADENKCEWIGGNILTHFGVEDKD